MLQQGTVSHSVDRDITHSVHDTGDLLAITKSVQQQ